jgi:hypothetical protein
MSKNKGGITMDKSTNKFTGAITHIQEQLRGDGRCLHGMLPMQCGTCKGIFTPVIGASIGSGRAWIRSQSFTALPMKRSFNAYNE